MFLRRQYGRERVKFSVKNQTNVGLLLELLEKWLYYKLRRFWIVFKFFRFCLILSVREKLKISISIIPQTLNISSYRTTSAKSINLDIKYSLTNFLVKGMFTNTTFEILLFEGRAILWPAQQATGSKRFKWKTQHNNKWSVLWAIHMTVLSIMKKGTGNLAYFDKNNYSFQDWSKNTCSKLRKS